ncbi:hypothetical protein E5H11_18010 [Escherichia coli]|nr:hypothetical protein [Escherichia coli]KAE9873155.1 hypothetical protein GP666_16765 [Escherichia coli]
MRRWRRLISPRMAALINCPVLSPSSFTFSMPSIISWAIRAVTDCDLAFFGPVAMSNSLCFWCKTIYTKKNYFEGLTCKTLLFHIVSYTLLMQGTETTKPRTVGAVTGLLTTNDSNSIEVAMLNHTTHPQGRDSHNLNKYIWRFIALSTAQPRVITIEATSETEYAGAFVPHSLAVMQLSADMALNEARAILIADCENGGVMRDDRFNALKQEFDGAPEDTDDALLCVADMMKAAFFLISTSGYRSEGVEILNIASDYAEYVAEARYRRKFPEGVSHE